MNLGHPYRAFGLNILSELEMPHWLPGHGPFDLSIHWGDPPESLAGAGCLHGLFWGNHDLCLLKYPDAGRVLIEKGARMTVAAALNVVEGGLARAIAGTAMAAVLYQRGQMCLHASAVAKDGKAILFAGFSGAGKSTLASAFVKQGYELISDDVTVIHPAPNGTFEAISSAPSVRLRPDSYFELELAGDQCFAESWEEKYCLRPQASFAAKATVISKICHLEVGPVQTPKTELIQGVQRIMAVQRNIFRPGLARLVGDTESILQTSIGLAQRLEFQRIIRPESGFHLERLCDLVTCPP